MEILSSQEAIDFFQSLQIPFPVYKPVEGQLKKDIEHALECLDQYSSSAASEDIGLQLKIAYSLLCLDRRGEAAAKFQHIKDATGSSTRVRVIACIERGILLGQKPELEAGLRLAEEHPGEVLDGDDYIRLHIVERGRYQLGRLHYQEEDFANAAEYLKAGLNVLKDTFEVHYALGVSHARIGDYSKAVEHLNTCISLRGPGSDVYHELGDTYLASGKYLEAVEAFVQSARLAGEVDMFGAESYKWWCAGAVAAERCQDHEQAARYLVLSLKAALKVQDPQMQARRLTDASTWLNLCMRASRQGKPLDQLLQDADLERVTRKQSQQERLETVQAEAYGTLGIAMLTYQSLDDARGLLRNAISLLLTHETSLVGSRERLLLFRFQWAEAVLFSVLQEHEMAVRAFQDSKSVAPTERDKLLCDIRCCNEKKHIDFLTPATMLANLKVENASLLETEWELKAELLLGLGQCLLGLGNAAEASVHLEAAKSLLEDRGCYTSDLLPLTYAMLYNALIQNGFFPRAFDLVSSFHAVLSEHHKESDHEQLLHLFAACSSRMLVDNEASKDTLTELLEKQDLKDPRLKCAALAALADAYRNQEDYAAAEAKYEEAMTLIGSNDALLQSQLYMSRAALYRSKAADAELNGEERDETMELNRKALRDYDHAIRIFEESKVLPLDLASAYAGQAIVLFHIHEYQAAACKLDRAMDLAGSNELLRAKIKRVRAHVLLEQGEFEQGVREAREAALLFAEVQVKLQHLESAWVTLLEGDMRHLFFLLQTAWVARRQSPRQALLWAERGRMRLYSHLADQRLATSNGSSRDPLAFDKDDDWAISCISDAVKGCGPGCVVVEYTYSPIRTKLYIFVAQHAPELAVECKSIDLTDFFSKQENRVMGATLDSLVRRTRTEIKRKAEDRAKAGLAVLYRLLLQPVWDMVDEQGNDTILFGPYGSIWLVPFAALYDESSSQFLVEKKKVGVIPSLRALQRCQLRREGSVKEQVAGFVAGDPEPMGLSCGQLGGAREEAIEVAKQLGVAPLIGSQMTKEAVIEGLESICAVVTLVTHGVVDALYPHGALVMQGKQQHQQQQQKMSNRAVDIDRLALRSNLVPRESSNILKQSSEVLTASEIEKLDVHAALVVLSACQTGEGEVPSEGLLGLARAILQAGTSCAVVTLWRVDDDATKQLMTGMFRELISNKRTVAEALRLSMLKLLGSKAPVYKWASAAALGFPMLQMLPAESSTHSPPLNELRPVAGQAENGGPSPATTIPNSKPTLTIPKRKKWFCRCCCWKS